MKNYIPTTITQFGNESDRFIVSFNILKSDEPTVRVVVRKRKNETKAQVTETLAMTDIEKREFEVDAITAINFLECGQILIL